MEKRPANERLKSVGNYLDYVRRIAASVRMHQDFFAFLPFNLFHSSFAIKRSNFAEFSFDFWTNGSVKQCSTISIFVITGRGVGLFLQNGSSAMFRVEF